jgi:hypothetical protein
MQHALDAVESVPTHIVYTPVWRPESEGGKFRKWLAVGSAWKGDGNEFLFEIDGLPINHEETATGYYRSVQVGAPAPKPLTVTRDEFLEGGYLARHQE